MELLVATRSGHKLREIREILAPVTGLRVLGLDDARIPEDPEEEHLEPYDSFEANARSKALWFHDRSGLPTVADDSGLAVDALAGAPGVRSKRFAPEEYRARMSVDAANNAWLVERLRDVPPEERTARYVCVAVMVDGNAELVTRGEAPGVVIDEPRGDGGFGYDPHILDPTSGRTFAELDPAEKNARSHRGEAFRALAALLQTWRGGAP